MAARRSTKQVFIPVLVLLAIMWAVEVVDAILPAQLDAYGIESRDLSGLLGIPLSPFLHSGFSHLFANTLPFLVLGILVAWRAKGYFWQVFLTIVVVGGLGVWLLGPSDAITIGASGVIFR